MERFKQLGIVLFTASLLCVGFELHADHLPYRNELNSDIKFWKKVFTEVSSNQYIIHDSQYLSIIYTVVTFRSTSSERERRRAIKAIKDKYERLLLQFHNNLKDTTELEVWERRIYDKFKTIKERNKFRLAARRIRAQQGIREKFVSGLQNSFAYLPLMEEIFEKYGLPQELIYMPHIESSFNINAASRAGAKGMWQFMWSTARYFMKINRIVDQRFDPIYSTEAAARLLKRNYDSLKDWALAITAYNHGLAGMKRAKRRFGGDYLKIRDGYLRRSFGFASKNFYPEFLAVVDIMDSLDHYFPKIEASPVFEFNEAVLQKPVNAKKLAKDLSLELDQLRKLNPSYKNVVWRGLRTINKGYPFRFPVNINTLEALAHLGFNTSPSEGPTKIESNREKIYDSLFQISFSKPGVGPEDKIQEIIPEFLSRGKPLQDLKSDDILKSTMSTLVAYNKPSVEPNDEVTIGQYPTNISYQDTEYEAELRRDLLAISLTKPNVDPGDILLFDYPFDLDGRADSENSKEKNESSDEFQPTDSRDIVENTQSPYRASNASYSISLSDITAILNERLKVSSNKIIIFPNETLGHIAEWLNVRASYLRSLNDLRYGQKIYSGKTLRLDFTYVMPEQFSARRLRYHQNQIIGMLDGKTEIRLMDYTVNPGENLWNIARKRYNFPVNLLLYFNDLNKLEQLYPGDIIKLPII